MNPLAPMRRRRVLQVGATLGSLLAREATSAHLGAHGVACARSGRG